MAATTYGSGGKYGITDESSKGLYAASLSLAVTTEQAFVKNHQGEDVGMTFFNEAAEITLSGVTTAANTTSQTIKAALDIANTDIYGGADTSVSTFAVSAITLTRTNSDYMTGDVTAIGRPGVTVS
jgi:hypothetical protein